MARMRSVRGGRVQFVAEAGLSVAVLVVVLVELVWGGLVHVCVCVFVCVHVLGGVC